MCQYPTQMERRLLALLSTLNQTKRHYRVMMGYSQQQVVRNEIADQTVQQLDLLQHQIAVDPISCMYWENSHWRLPQRKVWDSFALFVVRGSVRVYFAEHEEELTAGHVALIPNGMQHRMEWFGDDPALQQFSLHAHINDRFGRSLFERLSQHVVAVPHHLEWADRLHALAAVYAQDRPLARRLLEPALRQMLVDMVINGISFQHNDSTGDYRIDTMTELVLGDMSYDWSVTELAGQVGLGVVQFRKLCHRHLGCGPNQWMAQRRLQEACRLLQSTEESVADIAATVGFSSSDYFQRSFKRALGCTATEYRRTKAV